MLCAAISFLLRNFLLGRYWASHFQMGHPIIDLFSNFLYWPRYLEYYTELYFNNANQIRRRRGLHECGKWGPAIPLSRDETVDPLWRRRTVGSVEWALNCTPWRSERMSAKSDRKRTRSSNGAPSTGPCRVKANWQLGMKTLMLS